jgi:hypothetical protein
VTIDPEIDPRAAGVAARIARSLDAVEPPVGLAARTVAYVFAADATPSSVARTHRDEPVLLGRRRADLLIAAAIGFVVFGLGLSTVQKLRADASRAACQNTLRDLHVSLAEYAETHHGHYPAGPKAGDFVEELAKAGFAPRTLTCAADEPRPLSYTYTLGYRTPAGGVVGFRKPDPNRVTDDGMPLCADFPATAVAPAGGPFSPHGPGQNVLFAGGFVRYTTSARVGPNGDDIFRNRDGVVRAGLTAADACLGRPGDMP